MRPFTAIAAAIFLLMALVHLYRIAVGFPITVGGTSIGQEASWAALIVTLAMAAGLFREGLRGNPHHITLTAEFNQTNPNEIIVTSKTHLPRGSNEHRFKFALDDKTTKNVKFASLTSADDCSTCPPDTTKPNTQIWDVRMDNTPPHGQPRSAEFKNKNNNRPAMNVSYQWEFTCDDPAITVLPFDPIISNGGRV